MCLSSGEPSCETTQDTTANHGFVGRDIKASNVEEAPQLAGRDCYVLPLATDLHEQERRVSARHALAAVGWKTFDKYAGRDFHWKGKDRIYDGFELRFERILLLCKRRHVGFESGFSPL